MDEQIKRHTLIEMTVIPPKTDTPPGTPEEEGVLCLFKIY